MGILEGTPTTQGRTAVEKEPEPIGIAIARNPVMQTLTLMTVVSIIAWGVSPTNTAPSAFGLSMPLTDPWWALFTSIYTHFTPGHLTSNALMILIAGGLISLSTTPIRFHLFFITTGAVSIVAEVVISAEFGSAVTVLGASGAGFALGGYVIASAMSGAMRGSKSGATILMILLAGVLTVWFSGMNSAYLTHFVGTLLGLIAGWFHLLRA